MLSTIARRALLLLIAALVAAPARAEGVLDHLPPDALGFALVHNLSAANAKIEKMLKIFAGLSESAPPAPLAFIKAATGIGAGLDEQGDAALALLAGPHGAADPRPLLLAPVSDYSKFADSISGDPTGEVCRVTIAGEEVLVAKRGAYAMLMNIEHRPTMEALLAADSKSSDAVAPLAEWLTANDFAVVLTRAGVEALTALGGEAVAQQQAAMKEQLGDPQLGGGLEDDASALEFVETVLGFSASEVQAVGAGVAIDDDANLRISNRMAFAPDGAVAKFGDVKSLDASPLAGYPAEPFVLAAGGPLPAAWIDQLAGVIRRVMEKYRAEYGFQDFDEAQWQKVEDSWKTNVRGVRSVSSVLLVGEKTDPIFSNIFGVLKVDDSKEYLKSARQASEMWNELLSESTLDFAEKMKYDFEDVDVAGKPALKLTADVAAAGADERVPMIAPLFQSAVGEDGKLHIHIIAADDTTIVEAVAAESRLAKAVEQVLAGETGLVDSPSVQTTAKMLEPGAPWQALVSPQGAVAWVSRVVEHVFGQMAGGAGPVQIPKYPASPPVGFSADLTGAQFHAEMVWPVETLESLAAYIKKCQAM